MKRLIKFTQYKSQTNYIPFVSKWNRSHLYPVFVLRIGNTHCIDITINYTPKDLFVFEGVRVFFLWAIFLWRIEILSPKKIKTFQ